MFTYIKLKNFMSLGDVTFDFEKNASEVKPFVAIYGENGSGKSNFVKSIELLYNSLNSFEYGGDIEKYLSNIFNERVIADKLNKLHSRSSFTNYLSGCRMLDCEEPTVVEYGFRIKEHKGIYRLTFDKQIVGEYLYYFTGKISGTVFNISYFDDIKQIKVHFSPKVFGNTKVLNDLKIEVDKFWGKHTFLGILVRLFKEMNDDYSSRNIPNCLADVINLFLNTTVVSKESNSYIIGRVNSKPTNILNNMRRGMILKKHIDKLRCSEEILRDFFTQTYADIKDVQYSIEEIDNKRIRYKLFVDKMIAGKIRHISFDDESAGTQQVLEIVRMLLGLFCGVTVVYDEIDNGIHDILLKNIITSMADKITGQLIITTHNTMLLQSIGYHNAYVIRTDYLGNKKVSCLDEFDIQNNNNVRKMYLKGLFGGTPYDDDIDYDFIIDHLNDKEEG